MCDDFIQWIETVEAGEELLANLAEGLDEHAFEPPLLQAFAAECIKRLGSASSSGKLDPSAARNVVNYVVFDPPVDAAGQRIQFQYAARRDAPTPGAVETYVTWRKLWSLIPKTSALAKQISDAVDDDAFASTDPRYLDPDEMETVADLINAMGPNTTGFRISTMAASGDPFPVWMTTSEDRSRLSVTNNERLATRIRDWLGLGFASNGVPLFVFESRLPLDVAATYGLLSRPTAFDGIDHGWFKHRTHSHCPHGWGRTLDFEPARLGEINCDGAPEAIAPGSEFGTLFKCRYVGRLMTPPMPTKPFVLQALIGPDSDTAKAKAKLRAALGPRP